MHNQVDKLSSILGIAAAYRGFSESSDKLIQEGSVDIIYASPETLVGDPLWRTALQKLKVDVIVIDEFHTIATWGHGSDGTEKEAFRKWFAHIGERRSLFPDACILALSATCTTKIRKRVVKVLSLKIQMS
ncbi:ATP-dependent DNA helicase RecQ-like [Haliotis rubra]|uniref:ATP-dependent DNA helicase RecQ-like n=1 Tax=Haliotis rubra TaxID=36100 RepID=UPI001EE5E63E|nr:ATP-dependent DNA helicase RecQ-like [Haliotis rubra]